jgi:hypothetical protein
VYPYTYTHAGLTRRSSQVLELLEPSLAPFPNDQYIWVVDFHKFSIAVRRCSLSP